MRNPLWVLITAVLVLLVTYGAYAAYRNSSLSANFNSIQPGTPRKQVLLILGKPTSERNGCRDVPTWLGQPVAGKTCATEAQYDAKFLPKLWTIGFDDAGLVIAKYEYVSP
jgi:hypothetical protein